MKRDSYQSRDRAGGWGGGGNYSTIVSKYDFQLVRDGESSCKIRKTILEKKFFGVTTF